MIFILLVVLFYFNGHFTTVALKHPCDRDCGKEEMICTYEMNITLETAMNLFCGDCPFEAGDCLNEGCITAGGIVRPVTVANNMIPGPLIIVCENDTVEVTVRNKLRSETTSIHWHGIHQVGTFFMDGLPLISQYPLISLFINSKHHLTEHTCGMAIQEADGLYGAFIVRREEPDHIKSLYDFDLPDHIISVWHWYDKATADILVPILHKNQSVIGFGLLINGKANLKDFRRGSEIFYTPKQTLYVSQGFRYRFRLLFNSAIYCAIQVSVDDHKLQIIASETSYFEPVDVDSFMVGPGDRFDFVFNANQSPSCYPIRFKGIGDCGPPKAEVHEEALICYDNSTIKTFKSSYKDADRNGTLLNPFEKATYDYTDKKLIHFVDLNCTEPSIQNYNGTPNLTYYVEIQSRINENARFPGAWHQFNNISFLYPSTSFLQNKFNTNELCTDETKTNFCTKDFFSCSYIKKIPKDALIEIVLVDLNVDGVQDHPVHLHGYKFHIVAMEAVGSNISISDIKYKNERGLIKKNLKNAISKDTVSVPNRGYAVLRFFSSNPGTWLFHCHVTNHMELGMAMLLQVGSNEEIMSMCKIKRQCGHWCNSSMKIIPGTYLLLMSLFLFIIE